jgi:fumarylacetoacetase
VTAGSANRAATWVPVPHGARFTLANLPYGAFSTSGGETRIGVALGDSVVDLRALAGAGLFDAHVAGAAEVFGAATLNPLLARGRATWSAARARIVELLRADNREVHDAGLAERALVPIDRVALQLPIAVADYVDFYSSIEHATNLGKILRPGAEPLLPNYRWIPIGYHGRASTVVVSGTPVRRPRGQRKPPEAEAPTYEPSRMLDFELELGFITGDGPLDGAPISTDRAREYIFGVVLLNDWSARDVQGWEYQPLGPFLSKSFATSISPWVVTLDALEPFRVAGPVQEPPALDHLATRGAQNYDIALEASLASAATSRDGTEPSVVSRTNFRGMYWNMAQQLAHVTSNRSRVRAGDLFGSGTISGTEAGTYGSMIELTWRGAHPLLLGDGSQRAFLEDGDTVTMRGSCGDGDARVDLGEVAGTILPAG